MSSFETSMSRGAAIIAQSVCAAVICTSIAAAPARAHTYITFDVSGATGTSGRAIDANGDVAGVWYDAQQHTHGFLRQANGTITTFDPAGSTNTTVMAMNDSERVVGFFIDSQGTHGFIRLVSGAITVFNVPGSLGVTQIYAINNENEYTGVYLATTGGMDGFVETAQGAFASFAPGNDVESAVINDGGTVAGEYLLDGEFLGFNRANGGHITSFEIGGSNDPKVSGINAGGSIVGTAYIQGNNSSGKGFIVAPTGINTSFQVDAGYDTEAYSINTGGSVCGGYYDSNGNDHGYIRASSGTITSFDMSSAGATRATSINDSSVVTGDWYDVLDVEHGFVFIP